MCTYNEYHSHTTKMRRMKTRTMKMRTMKIRTMKMHTMKKNRPRYLFKRSFHKAQEALWYLTLCVSRPFRNASRTFHNGSRPFHNVSRSFQDRFTTVSQGPRTPLVSDVLRFATVSQRFEVVSQRPASRSFHKVQEVPWYLTFCVSRPFHGSFTTSHDRFTSVRVHEITDPFGI